MRSIGGEKHGNWIAAALWAAVVCLAGANPTHGGLIYWANFDGGDIRRANLDGSGQRILVKGLSSPVGPAVDPAGGQLYWGNVPNDVRRASLDGSGQTVLVRNSGGAPALDLIGGHMYWNDIVNGSIRRAGLDGSNPVTLVQGLKTVIAGQKGPSVIALDLMTPVIQAVLAADQVQVAWSCLAGRSYQLQFCDVLVPGQWNDLGLPLVATASTAAYLDERTPAVGRIYRVILLP